MTLQKSNVATVVRRFSFVWLAGAAVLLVASAAGAEELACTLAPAERVHVAEVIDGDTVVLADGSEVRLVGIQAPKLALGRKGFKTWPLAEKAKSALEEVALGRDGELRYGGRREDRHGRRLAHLFIDGEVGDGGSGDGGAGPVWAQGAMLERGLARTYSFADNRSCVDELLARERAARAAERGIWALGYYALRDAADEEGLEALQGSFQIVEGLVEDVAVVNRRAYLNFGQNYRHDFTISIGPRDARLFSSEELRALRGETVRVRGWIAVLNGPMIEVSHPEQIERLGAAR